MKILVTGAGGFLGFEITKLLVKEGHEVFNFSRNHHKKLDPISVKTIQGDLRKKVDVEKAVQGMDCVFHVAALAGVWGKKEDFFGINYEGTKNIVDAAKALGIKKFVYTSTPSVVFGDQDLIGVDESTPYPSRFYTHYAHSKSLAEKYVLENNSEKFVTCALRPHLIWGEGDPHIVPRLLDRAKAGKLKIVGDGTNLVDVIHVKNAAHAHVLAFKSDSVAGKAYFIGQEKPVNLWQFINQILRQKQAPEVKSKVPFKVAYALGGMMETVYSTLGLYHKEPPMTRFVAMQLAHSHYFSQEQAKNHFSYSPIISIEEGLKGL